MTNHKNNSIIYMVQMYLYVISIATVKFEYICIHSEE